MSAKNEDYRTNRADYLIAAKNRQATVGQQDPHAGLAADAGKPLGLRDWRFAALAANPCQSLPRPRRPNRPVL